MKFQVDDLLVYPDANGDIITWIKLKVGTWTREPVDDCSDVCDLDIENFLLRSLDGGRDVEFVFTPRGYVR